MTYYPSNLALIWIHQAPFVSYFEKKTRPAYKRDSRDKSQPKNMLCYNKNLWCCIEFMTIFFQQLHSFSAKENKCSVEVVEHCMHKFAINVTFLIKTLGMSSINIVTFYKNGLSPW